MLMKKTEKPFYRNLFFRLLLVSIVLLAQLIWWVIFTDNEYEDRINFIQAELSDKQRIAQNLLDMNGDSLTVQFIRNQGVGLKIVDSKVVIDQYYLDALIEDERGKRFMFISESSIFFLFILAAIFFVYRALQNEIKLRILQQNFLLSITHELKTPIASIKLYLQTLSKKKELESAQKQMFLDNSLSEVNRLNEMIENILYSVRLDSHPVVLNESKEDLSTVVEQIIEKNRQIYQRTINTNIEANLHHSIKAEAIELVLNNLISNAVKYSEEDIDISMKFDSNQIKCEVRDQGFGISSEEKNNIFQRFYRIGNEQTRMTEGTGMGLYIVKQIIDSAKGKIDCFDNQPKGSCFVITLNDGEKK